MTFSRSDKKRLLSWTGERCVPWTDELNVIHEHLHRYLFGTQFVSEKVVLDLGSGEGYGSQLLAQYAAKVVGLELDPLAVAHSRLHYDEENLSFEEGSVLDLSRFGEASIDVAVCFEVIEHLSDHDRLVSEVARVLRSDGLLIISTPDREIYNMELGHVNPYHLKELDRAEFASLLTGHFPHVAMYGQRAVTGSMMVPLESGPRADNVSLVVERKESRWSVIPAPPPKYLVAVASRRPLSELPGDSLLYDPGISASAGLPLRIRHPVLGGIMLLSRSLVQGLKRRLALAWRERNRRRESNASGKAADGN